MIYNWLFIVDKSIVLTFNKAFSVKKALCQVKSNLFFPITCSYFRGGSEGLSRGFRGLDLTEPSLNPH